jgi:NAD(P)-dependent dehydrogenase (short-subunit alcohol dehydrogenase family)
MGFSLFTPLSWNDTGFIMAGVLNTVYISIVAIVLGSFFGLIVGFLRSISNRYINIFMGSFLDISEEEMRRVFETDYFGAVALTRAIVPKMIEAGSGTIINIASLAGLMGHLFNAAYSGSKHALVGFSRSIRLELKPHNIKVVCVEPGYHKTEIIRANANVSENFYDRESCMFEYNRGFLRLMYDKVIPKAGEAEDVVKKIVEILGSENPKSHYGIGKDARFFTMMQRLGLMGFVEGKIYEKLSDAVRRENRRDAAKRARRKKKN